MNKLYLVALLTSFISFLVTDDIFGQNVLIENVVPVIQMDISDDGRLHVLSKEHLCTYYGKSKLTDCLAVRDGVSQFQLSSKDQTIFIAKDTIYFYKDEALIHVQAFPHITTATVLSQERLILATLSGLFAIDLTSYHLELFALEGEFINDISLLNQNQLVIGTDTGIAVYDFDTGQLVSKHPELIIKKLIADQDRRIISVTIDDLIIHLDEGLNIIQKRELGIGGIKELGFSNSQIAIRSKNGFHLLDENLMVEMAINGSFETMLLLPNTVLLSQGYKIYAYDLTTEVIYTPHNNYSIFGRDEDEYWIGGNKEIYYYQNDQLVLEIGIPTAKKDLYVSSIVVYGNRIFAGTMGDGLFIFDISGRYIDNVYSPNAKDRNNIIQLKVFNGSIWMAHLNGISVLDPITLNIKTEFDNLIANNYIYCVEPINDQEFYCGTSKDGLLYYDNGTVSNYLQGTSVFCIARKNDVIFAGTEKSGVYRISSNRVTDSILGIAPIYAMAIYEDYFIINDKNTSSIFSQIDSTQHPIFRGTLLNNQLNGIFDNQKALLSITENGLMKINKERIAKLFQIEILLDNPGLFDQRINKERHTFNYKENVFTFTFNLSSLYLNQNNYFKYRLLGLDSTWQTTQSNQVDYYRLNPGSYTFEVASGHQNDFNPIHPASYTFEIDRPFWETLWFLALALGLIGLTIYYTIKARERQLLQKEKEAKDKIKIELDKLKQQIDPHFLFNSFNSLIGLIEEDPELAVGATEKLSSLYRSILAYQDKELIDIQAELELAQAYLNINKIRYEDLLNMSIDVPKNIKGMVIPLSTQLLVENAIKHNVINSDKTLSITIYIKDNYLVVSNNINKKYRSEPQSGYGLDNLTTRYSLLTEDPVEIHTESNRFMVKIPIIHD